MFGLFDKADVEITLPMYVNMEDTFDCVIEIVPKTDISLRKIELELFCQETSVSRGTTDSYSRNKVFSDLRTPRGKTKLFANELLRHKEVFRLPQFTTPTIKTYNHFVEWFIYVRLDVPWWPDTRVQKELTILPFLVVPGLNS
jgi:hypothetical protein